MCVGHVINLVGNKANHGYLSPSVADHKPLAVMLWVKEVELRNL